jgi:RimJ/RimL family protein N-acetyltransferase
MAYGWEGDIVRLVPLDRVRHLDNALRWINDPVVTRWTDIGDWPLTRLAEEEYFDRAERESGDNVHFAVENLDGEHVGFSGLLRIDQRAGVAYSGSLIGAPELWGQGLGTDSALVRARYAPELWGQGLGTDAALVRARYAFEVLGLRLLIAEVMDGNTRSLRMLEKVGYTEAGRISRRYWKRGAYRDQIILTLHSDSRP